MCLLDAIHGIYIRVLAVLPAAGGEIWAKRGRFIRSLLAAGHCYGPLDPVSNIVVNAVFHDAASPPPPPPLDAGGDLYLPGDIYDTKAIVAPWKASSPAGNPMLEHEAIEYIWFRNCDIPGILQNSEGKKRNNNPYAAAAEAADHPQSAMVGSFLVSLSGEKLESLRQWLKPAGEGRVISDADWEKLNMMMIQVQQPIRSLKRKRSPSPETRLLHAQALPAISMVRSAYVKRERYLRAKLGELLDNYCRQHPWFDWKDKVVPESDFISI
uniref:PIR2-like helical domain-containing protein n=1 Tax=Leersia perrieri TaxID=77586 RepID=A0A0D9WT12_9ORYZ